MECTLVDWYHISAIVGVFLIVVTIVFAYFQFKNTIKQIENINKQMNVTSLFRVYDEMQDLHPFIHELYQTYRSEPDCTKWTEGQKINANKICINLERISFLTVKGFIDEDLLMEEYAGLFARTWYCLDLYVKQDRKKRGNALDITDGARLRRHYEIISKKAQKYYDQLGVSYKVENTIKEKYHSPPKIDS